MLHEMARVRHQKWNRDAGDSALTTEGGMWWSWGKRETSLSWVRYNPGHSIKATKGCNGCEMGSNGVRDWAGGGSWLSSVPHIMDSVSCNNINTGVLTHQPETGRGAKINKSQVVLTRTNGNLQSPWPSGRNQVPRARGDSGPLTRLCLLRHPPWVGVMLSLFLYFSCCKTKNLLKSKYSLRMQKLSRMWESLAIESLKN